LVILIKLTPSFPYFPAYHNDEIWPVSFEAEHNFLILLFNNLIPSLNNYLSSFIYLSFNSANYVNHKKQKTIP